jgi:hypothetical protein
LGKNRRALRAPSPLRYKLRQWREIARVPNREDHRMRLLPFVAIIVFFAASGSAFAADCTKGMLWPYTRNPGDCLTDAEIKAGKTGVYSGPVNTNVDVSSIKPDNSVLNSGGSVSGTGSVSGSTGFWGGYFSGGLFGSSSSAPSSNAVSCNKGYLWPFVREPGDCLTATEKLTDKTGVYRGGEVTQASVSNAPADDVGAVNPTNAPPPPASSPAACQKSWLWPFVRESGDCPTQAEKQANGVYRGGEVNQASASTAPAGDAGAGKPPASPPLQPASSASDCQRSLFWPFVRESGDCATDTNKKNGVYRGGEVTKVSTAPAGDAGAGNTPANASPPPAGGTPACEKGLLWPFVRKSGDCPTDTDKK